MGAHVLIAEASLVAEHDLWDCRLQWVQHTGSVVVAHRFNRLVACGIFLGQIKPMSPELNAKLPQLCLTLCDPMD